MSERHFDYSLQVRVAGVSHDNDDGTSRQKAIRRLGIGNQVELVRAPNNPYDPKAIEVHAPNRERNAAGELIQIGHLDRETAGWLAPELDQGIRWGGIIADLPGRTTKGVVLMIGQETKGK